MTAETKLIISGAVIVVLSLVSGYTLRGCIDGPRKQTTTVVRDTMTYDLDSIKAVVYAEMEGTVPAQIVPYPVRVPYAVPDSNGAALALRLYSVIDSLIAANDSIADIVATGFTKTDTYELSQAYSLKRREFGHVLTIYSADTTRTTDCPEQPTFWDLVQNYGIVGAIGVLLGALLIGSR